MRRPSWLPLLVLAALVLWAAVPSLIQPPPSLLAGTSVYDFMGIASPSSSHTAEDGEIDVIVTDIGTGTFSDRRDTIEGWADWHEASTSDYAALVGPDDQYYQGAAPWSGKNAAMIFEFYVTEDPTEITQIDVEVEAGRYGPGNALFVYLWNYTDSEYLIIGSMTGTEDTVVSDSVTTNPEDYVQTGDGQLTVFVVNQDMSEWIRVDDIRVTIHTPPTPTTTSTPTFTPAPCPLEGCPTPTSTPTPTITDTSTPTSALTPTITTTPSIMLTPAITPPPNSTDTPAGTPTPNSTSTSTPTIAPTPNGTPAETPASEVLPTVVAPTPSGLAGDVNCDGFVNAIDAALILELDARLIDSLDCPQNADAKEDGAVNAIDAALILQFDAGLIDRLPPS